jgi:hypothetical protein
VNPFARRKQRGPFDRLTVGLFAVALATAGTVFFGEYARMVRRRAAEGATGEGVRESAEHAIGAATQATQDTVTVAIEGYSETPRGETILFNILNGFIASFALMRLSTWGIRGGWWPAGNVRVGGRHVHHFVPGILIAFAAGGAGLVTQSKTTEAALAFPFGAGIGMTFDEAALLLKLDDVYWSREGLLSVQVSLGMTAIMATTLIALRMLRRGEKLSEEAGLIPDPKGEYLVVPAL